jgi:large subunit ribosomal protein L21e
MVKASKGLRRRTRSKLRKNAREKGLSTVARKLVSYKVGERACIVIDPSVHQGQPHHKFHGTTGTIKGSQGRSYVLEIRTGGKNKRIIASPAHLKRIGA